MNGVGSRGRLRDLDEIECRELLESRSVGRLAFATGDGVTVLPVNYVVHDDAVLFRTTPIGAIAAHVDGRRVAFEVDDIDDFTQSGWSVLVRGTGRFVESVDELPRDDLPDTWVAGVRSLFVTVGLGEVTGRRVLPS